MVKLKTKAADHPFDLKKNTEKFVDLHSHWDTLHSSEEDAGGQLNSHQGGDKREKSFPRAGEKTYFYIFVFVCSNEKLENHQRTINLWWFRSDSTDFSRLFRHTKRRRQAERKIYFCVFLLFRIKRRKTATTDSWPSLRPPDSEDDDVEWMLRWGNLFHGIAQMNY